MKLIRELRNEIDRLRTSLTTDLDSNDPNNNLAKKLAVKEAHERELTLEWTEKWKEAAKILDEHKALALKQTGRIMIFFLGFCIVFFGFWFLAENLLVCGSCSMTKTKYLAMRYKPF